MKFKWRVIARRMSRRIKQRDLLHKRSYGRTWDERVANASPKQRAKYERALELYFQIDPR